VNFEQIADTVTLTAIQGYQLAAASCLSRRSVSIVFANEYLLLSTMICSSAISSRNCRSEYQTPPAKIL